MAALLLAVAATTALGALSASAQVVGDTDGFVTDNFADASGGDAGSARGGTGGRGGSGALPICNQNDNDGWWEADLDCAAGARGGEAGDGGYSDGGDGGLAFTVDNTPPPPPPTTLIFLTAPIS